VPYNHFKTLLARCPSESRMNANANNFDPSGAGAGYYAHHSQGVAMPFYDDHHSAGEFYHPSRTNFNEYDDGAGYLDKPSYAMPLYQDPYGGWDVNGSTVAHDTESGYYYPTPPLTPTIYGAPVSAIAYDTRNAAIYVASHTQPFGERPRRASMLVTHSTLDGTLYSSCGGHPEAEMGILQSVYTVFFAGQGQASSKQRRLHHIPPHAYQPSYGATMQQPQAAHMGITTLLSTTPGFVTSVSPAGVRVHTIGGLCVSDNDTPGMICGTPHPESGFIHVSVGGQNSQIHSMDTYQDLRTVSSHTFPVELGVMALESNPHKRVLIAGCSDGTLRLVDGRMRGAEVAKMKSHMGGVSAVATSHDGTLVATTGFAAKSGSSSSSSNLGPYAYPDPNLLIYDIRFLGRGGIVHTFSGVKSGPRFVSFLPDMKDQPNNRFLVASGQPNGGMQILTPFEDNDQNPANFIFPQLNHGESITCMTLSEDFVALGTSQSNVLQYKLAGYKENRTKAAHNPNSAAFSGVTAGRSEKFSIDTPADLEQEEKAPLEMPNFVPETPALTIDPSVLKSSQHLGGMNKVFSSYIFCGNPTVSAVGPVEDSTFRADSKESYNPIVETYSRCDYTQCRFKE
jgi:WD40 repeat protein